MTRNGAVSDALLNGERAEQIRVTHLDDQTPDRWLIVLDGGWFETIVATCDYAAHARGVALALAEVLDCEASGVPEEAPL